MSDCDLDPVEQMGVLLSNAVDMIRAQLKEGAPVKITILVRHENDPLAHVFIGEESSEKALQGLTELCSDPGTINHRVSARGLERE